MESESKVSVLLLDRNGKIIYCNEVQKSMARSLSGIEVEEGREIYDYIADGSLIFRREVLERALQGQTASLVTEVKEPGGFSHWYSLHYSPVHADDGSIRGACLTGADISRLRRTEQALEESEERYRFLVENQNDLFVKLDSGWRLQFVNSSYRKMLGKTEEELLGQTFFNLIHEHDREQVKASLENLKQYPFVCHHEDRIMTQDGLRWIAWSDRAALDEDGRVLEVIAIGRDITIQKEAEAARRQSHREAGDLNREMTMPGNVF